MKNNINKRFITLFVGLWASQLCMINVCHAIPLEGDCSSAPNNCDIGLYCATVSGPGGSSSCQPCTNKPEHNSEYSTNGGTTATGCDWNCINGYKKNSGNTACEPCAAGYFYYATSQRCIKCPAGSTSAGTNNGNDCYWTRGTSTTNTTKITDPQNNYQILYSITSDPQIYLSKMLHKAAADAVQTQSTQE